MQDHTTRKTSEENIKLCKCGCGQKAALATRTDTRRGHIKGEPMRFALGHNGLKPRLPVDKSTLPPGTCGISLTKGKIAIVDAADYEWLMQWHWIAQRGGRTWYAIRNVHVGSGKTVMVHMHREIINTPDGMCTDHIDGNGLNNTRANLRICTRQENMHNRPANSNNTSGYKGVNWHKHTQKWRAQIRVDGRQIEIGSFDTPEEAARAYNEAAQELHGEFARINNERSVSKS